MSASVAPARNPYLGVGLYTIPEAARLLKVPARTLARWAEGYTFTYRDEKRFAAPLFRREHARLLEERILTFADLIEMMLIRMFSEHGVSMPTIRAAAAAAIREFGTGHPFATRRFHTDGKRLFLETRRDDSGPAVDSAFLRELPSFQLVLDEVARPFFFKLDYDQDEVLRYWPLGRDKGVVLDPRRSFGKPIVSRFGVPTWVLNEMVQAGETRDRVASWYEVSPEAVDAAVEFEQSLRIA
jgi:uncharacterized protein (DUF433 family)